MQTFRQDMMTLDIPLTPKLLAPGEGASMWARHDGYIFECADYGPAPGFYPVYRHGNLHSFSILPLIAAKGGLSFNSDFVDLNLRDGSDVARPNPTIDRDIVRIGGPGVFDQSLSDRDAFIAGMAEAMSEDIDEVCANNPGKTHVILCGGKDSLNILLADWKAPVVAYSAEPNFPLVRQFVADNGIDIEVRRLDDIDPGEGLIREIAEAACLVDLLNWKWTAHLKQISADLDHQVVFWKGQVADAFFTNYWRSYTSSRSEPYKFFKKAYRKIAKTAPGLVDPFFAKRAIADMQQAVWERAAVGQGAHLGFLRSICNALFLSVYHGPRAYDVMRRINFRALSHEDIRPAIGAALLGREVRYPAENPAPPPSGFRTGLRDVDQFAAALARLGIKA
ncbi:MAG: hypothetical protein ACJA1L_001287 [Paracoccaceae bacterium]|jgi:hypothetical protein